MAILRPLQAFALLAAFVASSTLGLAGEKEPKGKKYELGNGNNDILHVEPNKVHAHNGYLGFSAGVGAGATSDDRSSLSPVFGLRLNGIEVEDSYILDVDVYGYGRSTATIQNYDEESQNAGGGNVMFTGGKVFDQSTGCNGILAFGIDANVSATGIPRPEGKKGNSTVSHASVFRLQSGAVCLHGTNTVLISPYVGMGMGMFNKQNGFAVDLGNVVRMFLDDNLYVVADARYSHPGGKDAEPAHFAGRLALDFLLIPGDFLPTSKGLYLSADARVSTRLNPSDSDEFGPATVGEATLSATAAF